MIQMLGQGMLYQVHRHRIYWLTKLERRRVLRLLSGIVGCITAAVLLWIYR